MSSEPPVGGSFDLNGTIPFSPFTGLSVFVDEYGRTHYIFYSGVVAYQFVSDGAGSLACTAGPALVQEHELGLFSYPLLDPASSPQLSSSQQPPVDSYSPGNQQTTNTPASNNITSSSITPDHPNIVTAITTTLTTSPRTSIPKRTRNNLNTCSVCSPLSWEKCTTVEKSEQVCMG